MTLYEADSDARTNRTGKERAIALALQQKWEEAAEVNKALLEKYPEDFDAWNRLGKALMELGRNDEARDAYQRSLELSPSNAIAQRNLSRLARIKGEVGNGGAEVGAIQPGLFVEETGKSGMTRLVDLGPTEVLHRAAAGEPVLLEIDGRRLVVRTRRGEYVGRIEPRLAQRLLSLIEGGNRYTGAFLSSDEREVRIIIRETHQHPSQAGRMAFPTRRPDDFRSYVRSSVIRYDVEETSPEDSDEGEGGAEEGSGEEMEGMEVVDAEAEEGKERGSGDDAEEEEDG